MIYRTDLALEENENLSEKVDGIHSKEEQKEDCKITHISIEHQAAAERLHKPVGNYITLEVPAISDHIDGENRYMQYTAEELKKLLPKDGLVLVVGLGNWDITPDALGPMAAKWVLATRHIQGELARVTGLEGLRPVAVITSGVLGNTGVETSEMIQGMVSKLNPSAVIAVDALASCNLDRLGCTVQLCDAGISPGAGIGNMRPQINQETLGVPVIGMGVPTVVDAATLAANLLGADEADTETIRTKIAPRGAQMMVTPREVDLLITRASKLVAMAINTAINPGFSPDEFLSLVM